MGRRLWIFAGDISEFFSELINNYNSTISIPTVWLWIRRLLQSLCLSLIFVDFRRPSNTLLPILAGPRGDTTLIFPGGILIAKAKGEFTNSFEVIQA